jgi:hypothetical protein
MNGPTPQKVASISQFNGATDLGPQVNAAVQQANSAYTLANSAYTLANSVYGVANSAYLYANNAYYLANTLSTSIDGGGF